MMLQTANTKKVRPRTIYNWMLQKGATMIKQRIDIKRNTKYSLEENYNRYVKPLEEAGLLVSTVLSIEHGRIEGWQISKL